MSKAKKILEAVNARFFELDPQDQCLDIYNEFPEAELNLEEITPEFIKEMEESGHEITYRLPDDNFPVCYFIVTSKACLKYETEGMFAAEAAMM